MNRFESKESGEGGASTSSPVTAKSVVYVLANSNAEIDLGIAGATGNVVVTISDPAQAANFTANPASMSYNSGAPALPSSEVVEYTVTDDNDVYPLTVTIQTLPADYAPTVESNTVFVLASTTSIPVSITAYGDRTVTLAKVELADPQDWSVNVLGVISPDTALVANTPHSVQVTVTDQFGTATGTISINVEDPVDHLPRLTGLQVIHTTAPDLPVKTLASLNQPAANFVISPYFDHALFEIVSGELKFIAAPNQGSYVVIIQALNLSDFSSSDTTIVVSVTSPAGVYPVYTDANTSPVVAAGDTFVTQSLVTSSALPLSFSLSGVDAAMFLQASDGTISFAAAAIADNAYNVTSDVVDVNGLPSARNYYVTVPAASGGGSGGANPPVFSGTTNIAASINSSAVFTPSATGATTLQYTLTSSDLGVNITGNTGGITLQAIPSVAGTYTIVIKATDYNGDWAENTYTVVLS